MDSCNLGRTIQKPNGEVVCFVLISLDRPKVKNWDQIQGKIFGLSAISLDAKENTVVNDIVGVFSGQDVVVSK